MLRRVGVFAVFLLISCPAMAQDTASPPQMDLLDLWRAIRHKPPQTDEEPQGRMIAAVPVISRNPTFGLQFGFAAQVAFVAGDPATTRISSSVNSLTFSTQGQAFVNVKFDMYTSDSTWLIRGDNRVYKAGEAVYGLGTSTPSSAALDANYSLLRLHETVLRRVRGPLYLGGGLLFDSHSHIRPATATEQEWNAGPFITYSQEHGLPTGSQQSAGLSANVLVDRRVGEIDPRSGWMAQGWYRVSFSGFLSGDSSWQLAHLEYRAYVPLGAHAPAPESGKAGVPAKHRLTFWTFTDLTTTGVPPYFELPSTVSDIYGRSSRAYQQGRYRGEKLIYGEAEYRQMLTRNGLLGMVVFANAATFTNLSTGERLFDSVAPAAGAGLRVLFNKRSRTNLCVDGAFGKDGAKGLYLAIQDAF
jgi:hypothetical protein